MKIRSVVLFAAGTALLQTTVARSATIYGQTNLTSDISGLAANMDASLKNPWGMSFSSGSPFWVSDQMTGVATLYNGAGQKQALVVTIPPGAPTGQVFNSTSGFLEPNGQKATFMFATIPGTIDAWNSGSVTTAVVEATSTAAAYTGLALANNGSGDFLYAANFRTGHIDVYNSSFAAVSIGASFTDPTLPSGYAPYNIENVGGKLYVEYAQVDPVTHKAAVGPGLGFVSVFDANGNFQKRLVSNGPLNAPWGIALAPPTFGDFGNDLLIGNFGDGVINAVDPITGIVLGHLMDAQGKAIANPGLWALKFRTGFNGTDTTVDPNALYFTAGINEEADGLFGRIQVVPEPSTFAFTAVALVAACLRRCRRVLIRQ